MPKKPTKWRRWLVDLLIISLVILAIRLWQHQDLRQGTAPNLAGISLQQQPIQLNQFHGKPVLIHFFAPWCPICRLMHENVTNLQNDHQLLLVATQTNAAELQQWLAEHPQDLDIPIITDPTGSWLKAFGGQALPLTILLDNKGNITFSEVGYTSQLGLMLRYYWTNLTN